jgi:hypothetical protein
VIYDVAEIHCQKGAKLRKNNNVPYFVEMHSNFKPEQIFKV